MAKLVPLPCKHSRSSLRELTAASQSTTGYLQQCTGGQAAGGSSKRKGMGTPDPGKRCERQSLPESAAQRIRVLLLDLAERECKERPKFEVTHQESDGSSSNGSLCDLSPDAADAEYPDSIPLEYFDPIQCSHDNRHKLIDTLKPRASSFASEQLPLCKRRYSLLV